MATTSVMGFVSGLARPYERLPLFTRLVLAAIVAFQFAALQRWWDVRAWGKLEPEMLGLATLYRTNTYPLIHRNAFHALLNVLGLMPMLARFENEFGTLTSGALFFGPLSTLPAFLYVGVEKWVLRSNTAVMGASIWIFLLVGMDAVRTHRVNPYFVILGQRIPTWTMPIAALFALPVLLPGSSILGHVAGLLVGYICGLGYMKYLAPPEKAVRWIEGKFKLRARVPHYVGVDQKAHGRFGVLPLSATGAAPVVAPGLTGSNQRLGA